MRGDAPAAWEREIWVRAPASRGRDSWSVELGATGRLREQ